MMIALLIAGVFAIVAGLLAIIYGFLLELSFGNTLILAGAIGVCSGMIVLAQAVVISELRNLGRRLGPRAPGEPRVRPVLMPGAQAIQDQSAPLDEEPAPAAPPPWREEAASRDRMRQEPSLSGPSPSAPPPVEAAEPASPPPRRRNLLFSSTVRKDRDRSQPPTEELVPSDRPVLSAGESGEAPPPGFESAWPKPERPRVAEAPPRRASRPPAFTEADAPAGASERTAQAGRSEDQPGVTVIKSGVVDGMAYSLYSDGSIEAQMPEGMMRFASIDELRAHLDQRH